MAQFFGKSWINSFGIHRNATKAPPPKEERKHLLLVHIRSFDTLNDNKSPCNANRATGAFSYHRYSDTIGIMRWPWQKLSETLIFNRPPGLVIIVFYKFLAGLGDMILGFLFLFTIKGYIKKELAEYPQDEFLSFLIHGGHFKPETSTSVGQLFIFFGILNLIIAISLWYRSHTMRKILIGFLAMVTSYAFVVVLFHFTPFKLFCFLADLAILLYLWKIIPHHFNHPEYKKGLAEN